MTDYDAWLTDTEFGEETDCSDECEGDEADRVYDLWRDGEIEVLGWGEWEAKG